ncbi:nucleotide sugar dehydrogenase [Salibacterium aidingense]|uniref:nucleotide sugar dehydrogenase n=1 Tax=Salibacterium aidingense TaxID=384933 RepID=UPI003BCB6D6E
MNFKKRLKERKDSISVIGLGYVGMPLALSFARLVDVIGFDVDEEKVHSFKMGVDPMNEVDDTVMKETAAKFTAWEEELKKAKFHIVTVPTPINEDRTPDLKYVKKASEMLGKHLKKGSIIVFESTVYPGVTEDICIPILEKESGLNCGKDFKVGYSPERINPGDKVHTLENIVKIVSGCDQEALEEIAAVYGLIIHGGIHKANAIKVAEAAKVVENSQRDINIAFMNELAMVFDRMGIDTNEVIDAMNTKWNALGFKPGLVGGHCISVDPYYFIYEAEKLGYHSQIVTSGRKINDSMDEFVVNSIIKQLILADKIIKQAKIVVFGITFKENTSDTRNSKVIGIINNLKEYGIDPLIVDPYANEEELWNNYSLTLSSIEEISDADCLVFGVPHDTFKSLNWSYIDSFYKSNMDNSYKVLIDVKGMFDKNQMENMNIKYWSI